AADRQAAHQVARQAARISPKPQYLVRVVLQYFAAERIMLPGYSYLQEEIIGQAITHEEDRLVDILHTHLTHDDCAQLETLFLERDGWYQLTRLRRVPKDLGRGELRTERDRADDLQPFYNLAARVLPHFQLSPEAIQYYASLVGVYTAPRLKDLTSWMVYVYLLAFLHHRYHRLHDHLVSGFLHAVKGFRDEAKGIAVAQVAAFRLQRSQDMSRAGRVLQLMASDQSPTTAFVEVQEQAFAILPRERLAQTAAYIATGADWDETALYWQHITTLGRRFKPRLRPLLLGVTLQSSRSSSPLLTAVQFLQELFRRGRALTQVPPQTIPTRCIPVHLKRYLYTRINGTPQLQLDKYEFLIYQLVRTALETGELVCRQSLRFRSLEDDLIPLADWRATKEAYLAAMNLPRLQQPISDHLADLEQELEGQLDRVNGRIASGANMGVTVTHHGTTSHWTLSAPRGRESSNHTLFTRLPQTTLTQVLALVDQECGFMEAFEHALGRYAHHRRENRILRACLMAWGTNLGLHRMGDMSDVAGSTLVRTSGNYVRPETLQAASTTVINRLATSPLFQHHQIDGVVHSSSDGQKFETDLATVNARYSSKYFGLGKGVVAATLVINGAPVNARLISAHDHESHWVFDLVFNNPTDLQPTIHSTDTHGTNQVNFALLNVFGWRFAPRYADVQDKIRTRLCGFRVPSAYGADALIRPTRRINTELIRRYWDHLLRIFASLAQKTTSQSILITKLSSAKRRSPVLQALWEYDAIYTSLHLLEYVDSPQLRRNVHKALNRGEQYHQLRRALAYANGGKLRYVTEEEQEIWNETSRLLVNVIIFYNVLLLERAIAAAEARGDPETVARLMALSPVAWHHINFYGTYTFQEEPPAAPLAACVDAILRYQRQVLQAVEAEDGAA
ncbi:MAG TPA: Tn3 family transposase, partial [Herpetosiphonaceae bacterium]